MSNDTMVTVQGWLANDPDLRNVSGYSVASFRVGCTPRRFHRGRGEWVDQPTQWYAVSVWRDLAVNCASALKKGQPVIVHGRLSYRTYVNKNDVEVVSLEIDAVTVGHDLTRGVASFVKSPVRERSLPEPSEQPFAGAVPAPSMPTTDMPTTEEVAA